MTITISIEELRAFEDSLSDYHVKRFAKIMNDILPERDMAPPQRDMLKSRMLDIVAKYDETNKRPRLIPTV